MKPTPITDFKTITHTHADAKPPAYLARFQQHVALCLSPSEAMHAIERADGHCRAIPISAPSGNGGKGKPRRNRRIPTRDLVIPHLTRDWQAITPEFIALVGCAHDTIRRDGEKAALLFQVWQQPGPWHESDEFIQSAAHKYGCWKTERIGDIGPALREKRRELFPDLPELAEN